MSTHPHILVIEDDREINALIARGACGYTEATARIHRIYV